MKELLPVREENNFKPRPQNRILLPLGRSFQNFPRAPLSFLFGSPRIGSQMRHSLYWNIIAVVKNDLINHDDTSVRQRLI